MVVGASDRGLWDYWVVSAPALGSPLGLVGLGAAVVGRPGAIVPYWMMPGERATRLGSPELGVAGFVGPYVGRARCWPACADGGWPRRRTGLGHRCGWA